MQKPSIGRIVLYVLSDQDCRVINSRIEKQELRGNRVNPGEVYPLLISRVWPQELYGTESINGQVMLDGEGSHWLTSCHPNAERAPGTWHWPERMATPPNVSLADIFAALAPGFSITVTPGSVVIESGDAPLLKPKMDSISLIDAELSLDHSVILTQLELRVRRLCSHIETLGASAGITAASVEASNARQVLAALVTHEPLPPYLKSWLGGEPL